MNSHIVVYGILAGRHRGHVKCDFIAFHAIKNGWEKIKLVVKFNLSSHTSHITGFILRGLLYALHFIKRRSSLSANIISKLHLCTAFYGHSNNYKRNKEL